MQMDEIFNKSQNYINTVMRRHEELGKSLYEEVFQAQTMVERVKMTYSFTER